MNIRRVVLLLTVVLLPAGLRAQTCADANADVAQHLLEHARKFASDTSVSAVMFRDSVLTISVMPADSVALVTDEALCGQARAAYMATVTSTNPPHDVRVYVFRLRSDWLVVDPLEKTPRGIVGVLFDGSFVRKGRGAVGM